MADDDHPVRLAIVDDFEVVVAGLAQMLEPYASRIDAVHLPAGEPVRALVDVVLYDTFAQGEAHTGDLQTLLDHPHAKAVAVYTWNVERALIDIALAKGVSGYLAKSLSAIELVEALERIHAGETVVRTGTSANPPPRRGAWPGREHGLTERESEVLALLIRGLTNPEIADCLYLSVNSIKTHVRNLYRKLGVDRRSKAVLWGIEHGFRAERRVDDWR